MLDKSKIMFIQKRFNFSSGSYKKVEENDQL